MIKPGIFEKLGSPIKDEEELNTDRLVFFNDVIKYWRNEPSRITPEMAKNFGIYYTIESPSFSLQDAINKLTGTRGLTIDDIEDDALTQNNKSYLSLKSIHMTYWWEGTPRRTFFFK